MLELQKGGSEKADVWVSEFLFFFKYEAIQGTEKFLAAFLLGKV